jgi:hypothetical protein
LAALTGIREEEQHETWKSLNQRMNGNLRKRWNSWKHENSEKWRNSGEQEGVEGRGTSSVRKMSKGAESMKKGELAELKRATAVCSIII